MQPLIDWMMVELSIPVFFLKVNGYVQDNSKLFN
jgi:hypothetical protein